LLSFYIYQVGISNNFVFRNPNNLDKLSKLVATNKASKLNSDLNKSSGGGKTLLEKLEYEKENALLNSKSVVESLATTGKENSSIFSLTSNTDIMLLVEKWSAIGLYGSLSVVDILESIEGYMNMAELR
jgi:hypothetical protein